MRANLVPAASGPVQRGLTRGIELVGIRAAGDERPDGALIAAMCGLGQRGAWLFPEERARARYQREADDDHPQRTLYRVIV